MREEREIALCNLICRVKQKLKCLRVYIKQLGMEQGLKQFENVVIITF